MVVRTTVQMPDKYQDWPKQQQQQHIMDSLAEQRKMKLDLHVLAHLRWVLPWQVPPGAAPGPGRL